MCYLLELRLQENLTFTHSLTFSTVSSDNIQLKEGKCYLHNSFTQKLGIS